MKKIYGVLAGIMAMFARRILGVRGGPLMINGAGATFPYPLSRNGFMNIRTPIPA